MNGDQMDLLSDSPIARAKDPETSHQAAAEITQTKRATQQKAVRHLVLTYPGHTSAELAEIGGLDRYLVARRLPELRRRYVRNGENRKCTATGKKAMTWYPL